MVKLILVGQKCWI